MRRLLSILLSLPMLGAVLAGCSTTTVKSPTPNTTSADAEKQPPADPRKRATIRLQLAAGYYEDGKFSIAFVGYDSMETAAAIELTYNWDTDKYDIGTAYGHIAIGADNVYTACEKFAKAGANITRPAGPMKNGHRIIPKTERRVTACRCCKARRTNTSADDSRRTV